MDLKTIILEQAAIYKHDLYSSKNSKDWWKEWEGLDLYTKYVKKIDKRVTEYIILLETPINVLIGQRKNELLANLKECEQILDSKNRLIDKYTSYLEQVNTIFGDKQYKYFREHLNDYIDELIENDCYTDYLVDKISFIQRDINELTLDTVAVYKKHKLENICISLQQLQTSYNAMLKRTNSVNEWCDNILNIVNKHL